MIMVQLGTHVFILQGQGLKPSRMDPTLISANLHSNAVHIVSFTNPLDTAALFSVFLKGSHLEHFCLMMKQSRGILLHPGVCLDIPVMFAPEVMLRHNISLYVVADRGADLDSITWEYPIVGEPELRPFSPKSAFRLSCQAKDRLEQTLEVSLVHSAVTQSSAPNHPSSPGGPRGTSAELKDEEFTHQLVCASGDLASIVEHSVGIKLVQKTKKASEIALVFSVVFAPPKQFRYVTSIVCHKPMPFVRILKIYLMYSTCS